MKKIFTILLFLYTISLAAQETIYLDDSSVEFRFEIEGKTDSVWTESNNEPRPLFSNAEFLWLKYQIPENNFTDPVLMFDLFYGEVVVYYENEVIYSSIKENLESNIHHIIILPEKHKAEIIFRIKLPDKYYFNPIQNIIITEQLNISRIIDLITVSTIGHLYPVIFGSLHLIFSFFCIFLFFRSKNDRPVFLSFAVFTFIEGMILMLSNLFVLYIGVSARIFLQLYVSLSIAHNIALLFITNQIFFKGKSKRFKFILYLHFIYLIWLNIRLLFYPYTEFYEYLTKLCIVITFITIIITIIKNRKLIYSKFALYISLVYISLPVFSIIINLYPFNEISQIIYLGLNGVILFIFIFVAIEKFQKNQKTTLKQTVVLEQKENEMLKLEKEKLMSQLTVLKNQMNPHFLFNSLSTLTAIIDENQDKAIEYVEELSLVLRYVLQDGKKSLISLDSELRFVQSYAYLLSIRFHKSLTFKYSIDKEYLSKSIPPLTLQLMVENVVKHNLIDEEIPMLISIYIENGFLVVKNPLHITENGSEFRKKYTGIGQNNIRKLYEFYTEKPICISSNEKEYIVKLPLLESLSSLNGENEI